MGYPCAFDKGKQAHRDRLKRGKILGIMENGRYLFPAWQFDAQGDNGMVPGLLRVLKALDVTPIAQAAWLVRPHPAFEGRTPLDVLKAGDVARVEHEAYGVGSA